MVFREQLFRSVPVFLAHIHVPTELAVVVSLKFLAIGIPLPLFISLCLNFC
jgi:hypothetical protein